MMAQFIARSGTEAQEVALLQIIAQPSKSVKLSGTSPLCARRYLARFTEDSVSRFQTWVAETGKLPSCSAETRNDEQLCSRSMCVDGVNLHATGLAGMCVELLE